MKLNENASVLVVKAFDDAPDCEPLSPFDRIINKHIVMCSAVLRSNFKAGATTAGLRGRKSRGQRMEAAMSQLRGHLDASSPHHPPCTSRCHTSVTLMSTLKGFEHANMSSRPPWSRGRSMYSLAWGSPGSLARFESIKFSRSPGAEEGKGTAFMGEALLGRRKIRKRGGGGLARWGGS